MENISAKAPWKNHLGEVPFTLDYFDGSMFEAVEKIAEKYPNETAEDIAECYDQIAELKAAGELFAPDTFEPMAGALKAKTAGVIKKGAEGLP